MAGGWSQRKKGTGSHIWEGRLKIGVVEHSHEHDESFDEEKCLAVALLQVNGVDVYGLLDTGATPNVMSPQLVKRPHLKLEKTSKVV